MKHVFNIPASRSFLKTLCEYIDAGGGTAGDIILLPTRRACRALKETFAGLSPSGASLLPEIRPLGDVDEDGFAFIDYEDSDAGEGLLPAIPAVERNLVLASLVKKTPFPLSEELSYELAADLEHLLDSVEMEERDFSALEKLVPGRYSGYWQKTLEFLKIVTEFYPKILAERGYMDPVARKVALLKKQSRIWERFPPAGRIIAAGSTGSLVPVADLLAGIAKMERGFVVLPGLDRFMSEGDFQGAGQNHPQYGLKNLLLKMGLSRADVLDLPENDAKEPGFAAAREELASRIMLASVDGVAPDLPPLPKDVMEGVSRFELANGAEEALALALVVRDACEKGLKTHIVTPSRKLAKTVSSALGRWGLEVDDSAGRPASETAAGNYMLLALRALAEDFAPYPLLALLRHSFTRLGFSRAELESATDSLERFVLRGTCDITGLAGLEGALSSLKAARPDMDFSKAAALLRRLASAAAPLRKCMAGDAAAPLADLLREHMKFVEACVEDDGKEPGFSAKILYSGDLDSQLADELRKLLAELERLRGDPLGIDMLGASSYLGFISGRLFGMTLRPRRPGDGRVAIMNSIEARLLDAGVVVMAGLNEGTFPSLAADDPWFSRPMRADFGLPLPERKVGLSSHDFAEFFCRPRVVMTRAKKEGGAASLPSRWLQKLDAILESEGINPAVSYENYIMGALHGLDAPARIERAERPAPRPPAEARPKELWATWIEKWYRDPYIIYAGKILGLKRLDGVGEEPGASDFGTVVHRALEEFHQRGLKTAGELEGAMLREAAPFMRIDVIDFWLAKFRAIAEWFGGYEAGLRALGSRTFAEAEGSLAVSAGFALKAKADRIDVLPDGSGIVSDYKTGSVPSAREIGEGFAPQLPLEALILDAGGFADIGKAKPAELRYVELGGRKVSVYKDGLPALLARARKKLEETVDKFSRPETPYLSRPNPGKVGAAIEEYSEYAHLARVGEWDA
jgi:ATP-dependent helicase/nuclease subunit B